MPKVAIVTDSSTYLPKEYVDKYNIHVLPLTLIWGDEEYRDGVDISASDFYIKLAGSDTLPTTSQVTVHAFEELFKRLLAEGYDVLALQMSSGLSATVQSAFQAKEKINSDRIVVIDTLLVSMALGFQVLEAARAAEGGASLKECVEIAKKAYDHIGVFFTVDTLEYLHKGGRIGSAKRLLATALNVKPVMEVQEGKLELVESVISQKKAIERLIKLVEKNIGGNKKIKLSVFHAGITEIAQDLLDRVKEKFNPEESILTEVSPVIGAHTGPGTISIAYMAE